MPEDTRAFSLWVDEIKHADRLIERALATEDLPNLKDLDKLLIGEVAPAIPQCDLHFLDNGHSLSTYGYGRPKAEITSKEAVDLAIRHQTESLRRRHRC